MAIRPGIGRKSSTKNPPILSHEFVIQNHADIVSCFALLFVVGLMLQATTSIASIFIALHHSVAGQEPSAENPRGEAFFYESGWKDLCAVFFYTLICIIMHAILQEYLLDKLSKKLQVSSKSKLSRFNESGQLVFFSLMSFLWGIQIMVRDGFIASFSTTWTGYPDHPMSFLMKLYFIIQLAYYLHMLPELYFQKVKREEHREKIVHSLVGLAIVGATYYLKFQRVGVCLLTLHYFSDFISHVFVLAQIFDKKDSVATREWFYNVVFVMTRFVIMVLGVLGLFYGINTTPSIAMLFFTYMFQGYMFVHFVKAYFQRRREREELKSKKKGFNKADKKKKQPQIQAESDLPEADQNPNKIKSK